MKALLLTLVIAAGCFRGVHPRTAAACEARPHYFDDDELDLKFGDDLCVAGEDPLAVPPADQAYRFLWVRSVLDRVVVRVERSRGETVLTAVELRGVTVGRGDHSVGQYTRRRLTRDEWAAISRAFEAATFWSLSSEDQPLGFDGDSWVLEAKLDGKQHVVYRWNPGASAFRAACNAFLAASRFTFLRTR